jgi:hypothetical protein
MNSGTAIALMVIGAILILTPLVLGIEMREHMIIVHQLTVSSGQGFGHAGGPGFGQSLGQRLGRGAGMPQRARGGRLYALICLVAGIACLVIGILRSRQQPYPPSAPAIHRPA